MKSSLKIFLSAFVITFSSLLSALCSYKIYSSCEQVISGQSPEITVQKTGHSGTLYVSAGGKTYELDTADWQDLLSLAVNEIKTHGAELPEAVSAVYYAKQLFDELNKS